MRFVEKAREKVSPEKQKYFEMGMDDSKVRKLRDVSGFSFCSVAAYNLGLEIGNRLVTLFKKREKRFGKKTK